MSQPPGPLRPEQQRELVAQVGAVVTSQVPPGWRQLRVEYRAAGRHVEADLLVTGPDGVPRGVRPHPEAVRLLGVLRSGMYQPGRGTWLGAVLVFEPTRPPVVEFVRPDLEPPFRQSPPPVGFQDELRFFPRAEEHIPVWLLERAGLAPAPVPTTDGEVRTPRIWDGLDASGKPLIRREPLVPGEVERVLAYLDAAPVILASRSRGPDAFAPDREDAVPMNFRTDGSWAWPGAVAYYLREHGVAPDPDLLAHIRSRRFTAPADVPESTRDLALAAITGEQPQTSE
ncbi:ferredoxin [Amycolatopsis rhizosphaerae]|uniref:Ferredoxin n=1 Tax=Amycolatopsis rhizosphaerae TaxID=2053003 RepID=A0A558C807_9PSEU|nr:ferredoxin [Amycolatopsis rhizosphaerae]TVT44742.1 ferredoxin [Amycolatopsis rhizosphaerae]